MKPLNLLILIMALPLVSFASDLNLSTDITEKRSQIGASYEYSQFKLDEGTISGYGLRMTFSQAIKENWNLEAAFSAALNNQNSLQNSFTGFGGYAYYSLLGSQYKIQKKISVDGLPLLTEVVPQRHNLLIGAGLMQYFLNGNRGVYSSSGAGVGMVYKFDVGSWNLKIAARYHMMQAAQVDVKTLNFDLGFVFPL